MNLTTLDWTIIGAYFLFALAVGIGVSRSAGKNMQEFFLSGRNLPSYTSTWTMFAMQFLTESTPR